MHSVNAFAWTRFRYDGNDAQLSHKDTLTSVTNCIQIVRLINAIPLSGRELLYGQKKKTDCRFGSVYSIRVSSSFVNDRGI